MTQIMQRKGESAEEKIVITSIAIGTIGALSILGVSQLRTNRIEKTVSQTPAYVSNEAKLMEAQKTQADLLSHQDNSTPITISEKLVITGGYTATVLAGFIGVPTFISIMRKDYGKKKSKEQVS